MKRLGKRSSQKEVSKDTASQKSVAEVGSVISPETASSVTEPVSPASNKRHKKQMMLAGLILVLLVVAVAAAAVVWNKNRPDTATKIKEEQALMNKYVRDNNTTAALEHANKALALEPDNFEHILAVAYLTKKDNPEEAKKYFARALEVSKKQENPDGGGQKSIIYWAMAGLAEQAGYNDQAKKYYQQAIDNVDPLNSYHLDIAKQSQAALERLR